MGDRWKASYADGMFYEYAFWAFQRVVCIPSPIHNLYWPRRSNEPHSISLSFFTKSYKLVHIANKTGLYKKVTDRYQATTGAETEA
jgi:hypothetical protein